MISLIFAIVCILAVIWAAKKFYWPTEIAGHPERYPAESESKISKKELAILMTHLQRWRSEGKISREEYEHLTDVCLSEMQDKPKES